MSDDEKRRQRNRAKRARRSGRPEPLYTRNGMGLLVPAVPRDEAAEQLTAALRKHYPDGMPYPPEIVALLTSVQLSIFMYRDGEVSAEESLEALCKVADELPPQVWPFPAGLTPPKECIANADEES